MLDNWSDIESEEYDESSEESEENEESEDNEESENSSSEDDTDPGGWREVTGLKVKVNIGNVENKASYKFHISI